MGLVQQLVGVTRELELAHAHDIRDAVWQEARKRVMKSGLSRLLACVFFAALVVGAIPAVMRVGRYAAAWIPLPALLTDLIGAALFGLAWAASTTWLMRRAYRRAVRTVLNERGIPVCMTCGYSRVGLESPRCPECGHAF